MLTEVKNIHMQATINKIGWFKQIYDYLYFQANISILEVGITLHNYGCYGYQILRLI